MFNAHITKLGSKGAVVTLDQMLLYALSKHPEAKKVDGHYGQQTAADVLEFQKNYNKEHCLQPGQKGYLLEDGRVGNYDGKDTHGMGTREVLILEFQKAFNRSRRFEADLPEDGKMSPKVFAALKCYYSEYHQHGFGDNLDAVQIKAAKEGSLVIGATGNRPDEHLCNTSAQYTPKPIPRTNNVHRSGRAHT